jgi:hypothetical protein
MASQGIIWGMLLVFAVMPLSSQGLFEEATRGASQPNGSLDLGGYLRSAIFAGRALTPEAGQVKSAYGEFSLKLKAEKPGFGRAFTEFRGREGMEFDQPLKGFTLREAYVETYWGGLDIRVGHQIVVWGRADGFNPTDNITPKDMLARSADEDDRRLANFLVRTTYNALPLRLEGIWIPFYKSSRIPTEFISFPAGIQLEGEDYPSARFAHSTAALRLNFVFPGFDGSLSYFNGHNPFPALSADVTEDDVPLHPIDPLDIVLRSYRMHVVGLDFSSTWGSWGLRGEAAYRSPHGDYRRDASIIHPDLYGVVGMDHEFGAGMSVILQYLVRRVWDFQELIQPSRPDLLPAYQLAKKNRLLFSQQYEISHALSLRAAKSFWHDTLDLEVMGYVNITSHEYLLKPKLTYSITDAFSLIIGGEWYQGPDDSLFDLVDPYLSALFGELRLSF